MKFSIVFLFCLSIFVLEAQSPLRLPNFTGDYLNISVKENFYGYFDQTGKATIEDIKTAKFTEIDCFKYPRGQLIENDRCIWLRCQSDSLSFNKNNTPLYFFFDIKHTKIEGFYIKSDNKTHIVEWGKDTAGNDLPTQFLIPVFSDKNKTRTCYFRIKPFPHKIEDFSPRIMSLKGWRETAATKLFDNQIQYNITVFLSGALSLLAAFTFMQWTLYRSKTFLFYAVFLMAGISNLYRYDMEFALPVNWWTSFWCFQGNQFSTYLGHTFYFLFVSEFLELKKFMPRLNKLIVTAAKLGIVLLIFHLVFFFVFNRHDLAFAIYYPARFMLLGIAFFSIFAVFLSKPPFYRFIVIGGTAVAIGAVTWMISGLRIDEGLSPIKYASVIFYSGMMIESLFFLSGLGYKFVKSEEEKRLAQQKLMDERARLTRDLHDDIGSTLNSLAVMSELAEKQAENLPKPIAQTLFNLKTTARESVYRISDIVWSVNPNIEKVDDLIARMRNFTYLLFSETETRVQFKIAEQVENLLIPPEKRWHLYLIFKEVVNNVRKYAAATKLIIEISKHDSALFMKITDNGIGFNFSEKQTGNGLRTIQERIEAVGGTGSFLSEKDKGTLISIELPI